nr:PREDICTED: RNA-binding protein NOB1 [Megachile rotundata]
MNEKQKIQYLIVDTSAFIRNAALQDIGVNIITEEDVVNEVKNKRQLRRLVVLPYDLSIQHAHSENIKFVTEFSKKTGDYASLSSTDIKVIALTYQLEKEKVGVDHLKSEPAVKRIIDTSVEKAEDLSKPLAGFYIPQKKENNNEDNITELNSEELQESKFIEDNSNKKIDTNLENNVKDIDDEEDSESYSSESFSNPESDYETANSDIDNKTEDLSTKFSKLNCELTEFVVQDSNNIVYDVDNVLAPINENKNDKIEKHVSNEDDNDGDNDADDDDDGDDDGDDDDDDDNGWITPQNICSIKKELDSELLEEKPAVVACLTMDFAMQNVLKQIGLNVVALDGRMIKQMRTFILRCYACFKTTSIMTKVFCPSCGNKTLKKVAVTLNEEGKQQIHINFRKPISKKGKRFSLPTPKGGKHANNPILCEDQPLPDQRPSRLARTKNDPLHDDYVAGYSPFIMRDVYSKSAMLGIRPEGSIKYWMRRNPNECRRKK